MNVLIIGGSSDIGISLAKKLRDNNHQVIITYNKNYIKLDNIISIKCDVCLEDDIENVIKKALELFGEDYILINLASVSMDNNFLDKTKEEFMRVLEINLVGMFLCNQIYSKYNSNGLIINMSSTDGIDTYSEYSLDYSVSKAGIIHMSKIIGMISSNKIICICPNWIDSNTTNEIDKDYLDSELKRIGQSRLIRIDELIDSIYKIIIDNYNKKNRNTEVLRIDIRDDKLWIEKM